MWIREKLWIEEVTFDRFILCWEIDVRIESFRVK